MVDGTPPPPTWTPGRRAVPGRGSGRGHEPDRSVGITDPTVPVELTVNDKPVEGRRRADALADVLREELVATDPDLGCEHGVRGLHRAGLWGCPPGRADAGRPGRRHRGSPRSRGGTADAMHPVQQASDQARPFQCVALTGIHPERGGAAGREPDPTDPHEIRAELSGTLLLHRLPVDRRLGAHRRDHRRAGPAGTERAGASQHETSGLGFTVQLVKRVKDDGSSSGRA